MESEHVFELYIQCIVNLVLLKGQGTIAVSFFHSKIISCSAG